MDVAVNHAIRNRVRRCAWPAGIACSAWLFLACATPVGVKRVDPRTVHEALTSNVLSTGRLSNPAQIVLRRLNLESRYASDPDAVLSELHEVAATDGRPDVIFALAEASFLRAESTGHRARYRAAAMGPRFGKQSEAAASAIRDLGQEALKAYRSGNSVSVEVDGVSHALQPGDLEVLEASAATSFLGFIFFFKCARDSKFSNHNKPGYAY